MRICPSLVLCLVLVAGIAAAQPHPNGYVGVSGSNVFFFDGANITTLALGTSGSYGCVMGGMNSVLLVVSSGKVIKVDPVGKAVVGTLASGLTGAYDIAVDHNCDSFVVSSTTLWEVEHTGRVTTILTNLGSASGGMDIDIDTGELLIQDKSNGNRTLLVHRDGSAVTTVGSGADSRYGITQHIPTSDIYIGSCCGDFSPSESLFVLQAGTSVATVFLGSPTPPVGVYSLRADRSSAAVQQLILGAFSPASAPRGPGGFYSIDIFSKTVTHITTLNASLYETEILYRRNVFGSPNGKGKWDIGLSIPEDAGLQYTLGVSISGVRPGITLTDGRSINLTPDLFTTVGLTGGFWPYLTGLQGVLSAQGRGFASLDLSSFGSHVNGLRFFFIAVTYDPGASLGIKTITDPFLLKVEGA